MAESAARRRALRARGGRDAPAQRGCDLLQASWRLTYAGGILGAQLQKRDVWSLYSTRGGS